MTPRGIFALIAVTALATYLLRIVPLALLRRPLRNRYLVALLEYMPYALLSAMIFPDILYSTGGGASFPAAPPMPSVVGAAVAFVLAFFRMSLPLVAGVATLAAYLASIFLG
jgi:branched-subunit amino acid transport protein